MKKILLACLVAALAGGCQGGSEWSNPSKEDLPRMTQALKEGDENRRALAAEAMGRLGADGKAALPALLLALRDEGELVRQNALQSIIAIGPDGTATQPLTDSLKDSDALVRVLSANALGRLGPLARPALPALREALKDRDENVQQAAADALKVISATEKR
jgi:HEAT repeat protein